MQMTSLYPIEGSWDCEGEDNCSFISKCGEYCIWSPSLGYWVLTIAGKDVDEDEHFFDLLERNNLKIGGLIK